MKRYILSLVLCVMAGWMMAANTYIKCVGKQQTLTCTSTSDFYQWYKDGVKIDGATQKSYTISSVELGEHIYTCELRVPDPKLANNMFDNGSFESTVTGVFNTDHFGSDYNFKGDGAAVKDYYASHSGANNLYVATTNADQMWKHFINLPADDGDRYTVFDAGQQGRAWYANTSQNSRLKLEAGKKYIFSYSAANITAHDFGNADYNSTTNPTDADLTPYMQTGMYLVAVKLQHAYLGAYWTGTFNSWSTNYYNMVHFRPLNGFPYWYYALVPKDSNGNKGKVIIIKESDHDWSDGNWTNTSNISVLSGDENNLQLGNISQPARAIYTPDLSSRYSDNMKNVDRSPAVLTFKVVANGNTYELATINLNCGQGGSTEAHDWIRKQAVFISPVTSNNVEINVTNTQNAAMGNDFALDRIMFQLEDDSNTKVVGTAEWTIKGLANPEITVDDNLSICTGENLAVSYTATNAPAQYQAAILQGSTTKKTIGWTALPSTTAGTITLPTASLPAGTYKARITARISDYLCESDVQVVNFTIHAKPQLLISPVAATCVSEGKVSITATANGAAPTKYDLTVPGSSYPAITNHAWASPIEITMPASGATGTYNAKLKVYNASGCDTTYTIPFTVNALPTVAFTDPVHICADGLTDNIISLPYTFTNASQYTVVLKNTSTSWTQTYTSATNSNPIQMTVPKEQAGQINGTLTVSSPAGCVSEEKHFVVDIYKSPTATAAPVPTIGKTDSQFAITLTSTSNAAYYQLIDLPTNFQPISSDPFIPLPADNKIQVKITGPGAGSGYFTLRVWNSEHTCYTDLMINYQVAADCGIVVSPHDMTVCETETNVVLNFNTTGTPVKYEFFISPADAGNPNNHFVNGFYTPSASGKFTLPLNGTGKGVYNVLIKVYDTPSSVGSTATATITVLGVPTVAFTSYPTEICAGQTLPLVFSSTNVKNYKVDVLRGSVSKTSQTGTGALSTVNLPLADNLATGNYTVRATVSNGECGDVVEEKTVKIYAIPTVSISSCPTQICAGNDLTVGFSATNVAGYTVELRQGATTLQTLSGTGTLSSKTFTLPTTMTNGIYTVVATVTNGPCTEASATQNFTLYAKPTISLTGTPDPICAGETLTLNYTTENVSNYTIQLLNGSTILDEKSATSSLGTYDLALSSSLAAGTYTVLATVENGCCSATNTTAITVLRKPVMTLTAPADYCADGNAHNVSLAYTITDGSLSGFTGTASCGTWSASISKTTTATTGTIDLTIPASVHGTVAVSVTPSNGACSAAAPATCAFDIYETPYLSVLNVPSHICRNELSIGLYAEASVLPTTWDLTFDGSVSFTPVYGQLWPATNKLEHDVLIPATQAPGSYTAYLTLHSAHCDSTYAISFTLHNNPTMTLNTPDDICSDGTAKTVNINYTITGSDITGFSGTATCGSWSQDISTTSTAGSGTITLNIPANVYGNVDVSATANTTYCSATATTSTSFRLNALPTITLGSISNLPYDATSVTMPYTVPSGSTAKTYEATIDGVSGISATGDVNVPGGNIVISGFSSLIPGAHNISVVVTSDKGCTDTFTQSFLVVAEQGITPSEMTYAICYDTHNPMSFTVPFTLSAGAPSKYKMTFDGGGFTPVTTWTPLPTDHSFSIACGSTTPGTYHATITVTDDSETSTSSNTITLVINQPTTGEETITACSSYAWHGATYTASGDYTWSTTNAQGCDSTATLHLTINQPTTGEETITACSSYTWHGATYTASGDYTWSTTNAQGCDSTATLHLTINQPTTGEETVTACSSYTWHGATYTATGDYTWSTTNAQGCDSTATLHLTINQPTTGEENVTACSSYAWHGATYTASGDYTWSTTNAQGCDSTATLHLTINQPTTGEENVTACSSYTWHGATYTASGDYTWSTTNAQGCDSTATLHLTINQPTTGEETVTACSSYTWHGATYTASGDYTWSTTNAQGCDSTATLHLTINQPTTGEENVTACSSYTWHGATYTATGDYTWSTTNAQGCDSTATLHLTINQPTTGEETVTACSSYTWHGATYTASGDYTWSTTNAQGCDSTATLHLTINQPATIALNIPAVICTDGNAEIALAYSITEGTPGSYSVTMNWPNATPVVDAVLGEYIQIPVPADLRWGRYTGTVSVTDATGDCETAQTFAVTIGSDSLVYRKWDDLIFASDEKKINTSYQWFINGQAIEGATGQYYDKSITMNDEYYVRVTNTLGDTIYSCPNTFEGFQPSAAINPGKAVMVKVAPNPLHAGETAQLIVSGLEHYSSRIVSTTGQTIHILEPDAQQVEFTANTGTYVLHVVDSETGHDYPVMLLIE